MLKYLRYAVYKSFRAHLMFLTLHVVERSVKYVNNTTIKLAKLCWFETEMCYKMSAIFFLTIFFFWFGIILYLIEPNYLQFLIMILNFKRLNFDNLNSYIVTITTNIKDL